jgi:surfactin synthase thioesterase subunit
MPATLTLFTLPCAGASSVMYLRWRNRLPSWVQLVPVELPGRGRRLHEAPESNLDTLAARLCDELGTHLPARYSLFGHSMGGLLAYRLVQRLYVERRPLPVALLVSACAAPSRQDWKRYADKTTHASLVAELRKQNGTPDEVFKSPELLAMTLDLLSVDYQACASFRYQRLQPLPLPIHVFGGREDEIHSDKLTAWQEESTVCTSVDWLDGGHFFLRRNEDAFLSVLVKRLEERRIESSNRPNAALNSA